MDRVFNFSAGPAVFPLSVLEQAQSEMLALPGTGMSVLEMSHRSAGFDAIIEEAEANVRRLVGVPDDYRVLFLQGGGQLQFSMVPMNYLRGRDVAVDMVLTGAWGNKARIQTEREGRVHVAWDGKEGNYTRVPAAGELELSPDSAYVHVTSNETIHGVQFREFPEAPGGRLVCDASSDFLSRPIDIERYGLLYACAQKNAGPAGLTVVIVSDEMLELGASGLHSMLDYRAQAKAGSRLNTPPCFAIYLFMLVTRWLENEIGGLEVMAKRNEQKAQRLYEVLDEDGGVFYTPHAEKDSRSLMNVTFRLVRDDLEETFFAQAAERSLVSLKGHRSVGGVRASIYNAMPEEGVEALRAFLIDFKQEHG